MLFLKLHIVSADDGSQGIAEDQASSPESPAVEDIKNVADDKKDDVQIETHVGKTEIPSASKVEDKNAGVISDKNGSVPDSNDQTSVPSSNENVTKGLPSCPLFSCLIDSFLVSQMLGPRKQVDNNN